MTPEKLLRNDTAKQYKAVRKLLHGNLPQRDNDQEKVPLWGRILQIITIIGLLAGIILLLQGCARAYTLDQYANAIKHAEGNSNYGILNHYKHTSYRQACKNTVWHSWTRFKQINRNLPLKTLSARDFVGFLGKTYCPVGVRNDNGTNRFWIRNVNYWLMKG